MSVHSWWGANLAVLFIGLSLSVVNQIQLIAYEQRFEGYEKYVMRVRQKFNVYVNLHANQCVTLSRLNRECIDKHREMCRPPPP